MTISENEKKKKTNEDEWGFEDSSSGFSKEAKVGLTIIVILAGVLGYYGYQKFGGGTSDENDQVASNEEKAENPNEPQENKLTPLPSVNSDSNPFGGSAENPQQEPETNPFGDEPNNTGTVNLSSSNDSLASNPFAGNDPNENSNSEPLPNRETGAQNASSGNPFGSNENRNLQTNANKALSQTESPNYFQNQDNRSQHPLQTNRDSFRNNQADTETAKADEWGNFSRPVTENNQQDSGSTDTTTAGFETDSGIDSGYNSTQRNTTGQNANRQTYDSRFGAYRPANSAQNSASNRIPTGSSNYNTSNRPANKYNAYNNTSPNSFGYRQTQSYSPRPLPTDRPQYHKISNGDNYWNLSKRYYQAGRYFRALEEYNKYRISDSRKMRAGMIVLIPGREILDQRFSKYISGGKKTTNRNANSPNSISGYFRGTNDQPMYRTGKNDVLTKIAQKHLGRSSRWIQIYEMNRHILKNPNDLKIGIELWLPTDASNVRIVQEIREIR